MTDIGQLIKLNWNFLAEHDIYILCLLFYLFVYFYLDD